MKFTFAALKELISQEKNKAKDEVLSAYKVARSCGNECSAQISDEKLEPQSFNTKKELMGIITSHIDNPEVKEIWIDGSYDAAESVLDMNNGDHDAGVEYWGFLIWSREHGYYTLEQIEEELAKEY
ncbi:MAG: hypothetical protein HAW67_03515 [Endozoicomonadaceae bacterium]|nr:hypothetical protein [Endozoicomonadaceae bacterium]